jgi:transketolase
MTNVTAKMEDVFSEEAQAQSPNVVAEELTRLAEAHPEVVVLSADMGAALVPVRQAFPDRYFDLGIAETNTISVAAGLASCGFVPYVVSMAPFGMLKCAEQIRTDLAATKMPVRIVTRLSGLAMGFFGVSHHAIEDLAIARSITNLTVCAPSDACSTLALLRSTFDVDGPVLIRTSEGVTRSVYSTVPTIPRGSCTVVRPGDDASVIATGLGTSAALDAAEALAADGVDVRVIDAAYLKPFDEQAVLEAASTGAVLTVEEHHALGGLGSMVAEVLGRHGMNVRLDSLALPDEDLEVGVPGELIEHYGITSTGITERLRRLVGA